MTDNISSASRNSDYALEARGLTCVRGERQLFADLHLRLSSGNCLHVRGENGVGKTSLLRLLTGLSKPEAGQVLWCKELITSNPLAYQRALLFSGHRDALKDDLTALENLQMYAALDDVPLTQDKALSALWRFGLRGREDLPVHCLSAGQKRRVILARMLTRQANLWILDEPFNALDTQAVEELQNLIIEHVQYGGLVVLTSHQEINIPNVQVLDL